MHTCNYEYLLSLLLRRIYYIVVDDVEKVAVSGIISMVALHIVRRIFTAYFPKNMILLYALYAFGI